MGLEGLGLREGAQEGAEAYLVYPVGLVSLVVVVVCF
jgi:hypothetical protein